MNKEDADYLQRLYHISPELTCTCHDDHVCQQCFERDDNNNVNKEL